jgi:hypothetical protein
MLHLHNKNAGILVVFLTFQNILQKQLVIVMLTTGALPEERMRNL